MIHLLLGLLLLTTMAQKQGYQGKYDDSIISKAGQYAPNKVGSPVQAMQEEFDYQRKERERTQQMVQNNQKQALTNLEQGGKNAVQKGKELEELGKFSETLTNKLIDIQHERNEAEYQKGLARYFTEGAPMDMVQQQDQGEEAVSAADRELKSVAYKAEEDGAPTPVVRQLRGMSGWARLGYQAGLLQNAGLQYNSFMQQQADREYDIGLATPVSLKTANDSGERAAVQNMIRAEYLAQFTGYNPAMLNKHLFPKMKEAEALSQVEWDKEQKVRLQADRQDEMSGFVMQQIKGGNGGQGVIAALDQFKGDYKSNRDTRKAVIDMLKSATENRSITQQQVEQILQYRFKDNQGKWVTIEDKWPGEFGKLRDIARKAGIDEVKRKETELLVEQTKYKQLMRAQEEERYMTGKGKYTEEELKVIIQDFEKDFPGSPIPDWLKEWTTQEDQRDEDIEDLLKQKQAMRQALRWEDLRGLSPDKINEWLPKVKADEGLTGVGGSMMKQGEKLVRRAVRDGFSLDSADDQLDTRGEMMVIRATSAWSNLYAERIRAGDTPEDALEYATEKILKPLEDLGEKGEITKSPFYRYSGKSNEEQVTNRKVQVINNAMSADPTLVKTGILPNTQEDLQDLVKFQQTGKGEIPEIYKRVAAQNPGWDAFSVANDQLIATGNQPLIAGPIQQSLDQLDPSVKALLVYRPSNGRTTRAMFGGDKGNGQDNWTTFLNMVASVESKGFGDYDAMNIPYTNAPYNSNDRLGQGLSSMTIGQVLELQRTDKVHAAGRYQFTNHQGTLREAMREAGLTEADAFSPENQDKLAVARARWRMRVDGGMAGLRREWVGLNNVADSVLRPAMNGIIDERSVYNRKENLTPGVARRVYTTGNIGPTSTGQHLDVKQVGGGYFEYGDLDNYVEVDDPELGRVPLGRVPETGDWESHTVRGSHGRDYGTYSGTPVYVKNGARLIGSVPTEHGDKVTIELPDGRQFTFLHGTRK